MMTYRIARATTMPLGESWNDPAWAAANIAQIDNFRPESSTHRPRVAARFLYDEDGISGIYQVEDQYVRSVRTEYCSEVWKDSCVEFFVQPRPDRGYFNLEMNAGGAHLIWYIEDPTRDANGLKKWTKVPNELGTKIQIRSSLPKVVDPEIAKPITWELSFLLPRTVLEKLVGPLGNPTGQQWRGNFFKCAEDISHPHWASWSPVDEFNFHLPLCFGALNFDS
jgi:hypothetical protein